MWLKYSMINGCVWMDSVVVDVLSLPVFNLGKDTSLCYATNLDLSVSGLGIVGLDSVNWYSKTTGSLLKNSESLSYQVMGKDTLIAEVFNANGCVNYDSLVVNAFAFPVFTLGNDTSICYGETLPLSVASFVSTNVGEVSFDQVNWYSTRQGSLLADSETLSFEVLEKDTLVVEVKTIKGCLSYDSLIVDVLALPVFDIGNDTSICYGSNILLQTGALFEEVNWYSLDKDVKLVSDNWFFNYEVTATDTLVAEVFNASRCVNYDTIIIVMDPLPVFSLGDDQAICYGDSASLVVSGGFSKVDWFTTGNQILQSNSATYKFQVLETITLWAEVTNAKGCIQYDTITITSLDLPEFDLGEDQTYCYGDQVTLNVPVTGTDFTWTNGAGEELHSNAQWEFLAEETIELFLTVKNAGGCFYNDSVMINVNPLPDFDIVGDAVICVNDTTQLTTNYSDIATIRWFDQNDITLGADPTLKYGSKTSGYVYANIINSNDCRAIDSLFVTVNTLPLADAGKDTLICFGEAVKIGSDQEEAGYIYLWTASVGAQPESVADPLVSPTVSTFYYLQVTDANGCVSLDTVSVQVNPKITIAAGEDFMICKGEQVTLGGQPTASGSLFDYSYQWTKGGAVFSNKSNPTDVPEVTTTYFLEVSSHLCDVQYDTITVTVNEAPEITVSPQLSVGGSESVELFATGGVSYSWSPAGTLDDPKSATPKASPLVTTEYEVVVTDANGCVSIGRVNVLVQNALFIPNLFTPNGDRNNDEFLVYGSGIQSITFSVYDLNGNRVYTTGNVDEALKVGWDGTYKGEPLANGVYLWSIQGSFYNGAPLKFEGKTKGTVKLIR